eukprot:5305258-Pyramimonas_sp.AAC.1
MKFAWTTAPSLCGIPSSLIRKRTVAQEELFIIKGAIVQAKFVETVLKSTQRARGFIGRV